MERIKFLSSALYTVNPLTKVGYFFFFLTLTLALVTEELYHLAVESVCIQLIKLHHPPKLNLIGDHTADELPSVTPSIK